MKKTKRIVASLLAVALVASSVFVSSAESDAAKKVSLNSKKKTIAAGQSFTLKIKNKAKKAKVTWKSSDKKIVKLSKKVSKAKKASVKVTGAAEGTAKVTAVYKLGKKKTKLVCKVTVGKAQAEVTPTAAATQGAAASNAPTAAATTVPADPKPTVKPTAKPTRTPRPTATPSPTPKPYLVNGYSLDLSSAAIVGENGGSAAYNEETKTIDSTMAGVTGFIINGGITERADEYTYLSVTYTLEGGDVNAYIADGTLEGDGSGQDAKGWSDEIKLNEYTIGEETTVLFKTVDHFPTGDGSISALKIFNFGDDTTIKIKDITFYMDGYVSERDPYVATKINAEEDTAAITIDGLAESAWNDVKSYAFESKVPLSGTETPTDTSATVKFLHDLSNLYLFIDVKDSSIDQSSENNFDRDGLELLFDEDNCKKDGSDSTDWTTNPDAFHYRFTGLDKDSEEKSNLLGTTAAIQGGGELGKLYVVEAKYALTEDGYTIEAKVPFSAVKSVGDKVSIDLIIQDCKDGVRANELYLLHAEEARVYWNNSSAAFASLILGE